jgi:hypothetical protein
MAMTKCEFDLRTIYETAYGHPSKLVAFHRPGYAVGTGHDAVAFIARNGHLLRNASMDFHDADDPQEDAK